VVDGNDRQRQQFLENKTQMYYPIQLTISIPTVTKTSISRSPFRLGFVIIALALAWFPLSSTTRAVDPPPDGGYPNHNTAEGDSVLLNLTTGTSNTATGVSALFSNTAGSSNTASGNRALVVNTTGDDNTANGFAALQGNTIGNNNTANGVEALQGNATGDSNTANGHQALYF